MENKRIYEWPMGNFTGSNHIFQFIILIIRYDLSMFSTFRRIWNAYPVRWILFCEILNCIKHPGEFFLLKQRFVSYNNPTDRSMEPTTLCLENEFTLERKIWITILQTHQLDVIHKWWKNPNSPATKKNKIDHSLNLVSWFFHWLVESKL